MNSANTKIRTKVLIVGAGPAGLAAGLLLKKYETDFLAVTKYRWTAHTPRAHHINPRAMELLRMLGLEEAVRDRAMPRDLIQNVVWCESLAGQEFARLKTYHQAGSAGYHDFTPSSAENIPQHELEPVMAEALLRQEGELLFNCECVDIEEGPDDVTTTVRNRITGQTFQVVSDYVIGADGANSLVAEKIGLPFLGHRGWGAAVNVWIEADLTRFCAHRPGVLYWTNLPGNDFWVGSGVFLTIKPWSEWMVSFMYDPSQGELDASEDVIKEKVLNIIGDRSIEIGIKSVTKWLMNAQFAEKLSSGRVFCVGDAIHRHSPANGLGANTSMLDAFNLCWKLSWVLKGRAPSDLLSTYNTERQPVAKSIIERSMKSVKDFTQVAEALGYHPGQNLEDALRRLKELEEGGRESEQRRDHLLKAVDHQNYHFNALGFEMGARYEDGAIVKGPAERATNDDPDLKYSPVVKAGCHLPHAWLAQGTAKLSSLDIVCNDSLYLFTGNGGEKWLHLLSELERKISAPVNVVLIGPGLDYEDPYGSWRRVRRISDDGCILVRPDRYVAWLCESYNESASDDLLKALSAISRKF